MDSPPGLCLFFKGGTQTQLPNKMDETALILMLHGVCEHEKDTLRPDLGQPLYLTGAAGERLRHHEKQVGVFYPLCMEQPTGDSDGCVADSGQRLQFGCESIHKL